MNNLFQLQVTRYNDDYKNRYDNGIYPDKPKLFATMESLYTYLNSYLVEEINEYMEQLHDNEVKEIDETLIQFYQSKRIVWGVRSFNTYSIKSEYQNDFTVLKRMYESYFKGEYVDYDFDWKINQVVIN